MTEFPDFRGRPVAVDTETFDPYLKSKGPGFFRKHNDPAKDSRLLGVSLANRDASVYVPLEATDTPVDRDRNLRYLQEQLRDVNEKRFAHALYDFESLDSVGLVVHGCVYDVLTQEHLLNENLRRIDLAYCGQKYCGALLTAHQQQLDLKPQRDTLHTLPLQEVADYARLDAELTFHVAEAQAMYLEGEGLNRVAELERRMIPVLWGIRKNGVRLDEEYLEALQQAAKDELAILQSKLEDETWPDFNVWAPTDMLELFVQRGLPVTDTPKGNPSFKSDVLQELGDPVLNLILQLRGVQKLQRDFIDRYLADAIDGRLFAQFHSNRTVTGRMSSSHPNLQQVPKRTEQGAAIRRAFLPEPGCAWESLDYRSQEPRLAVVLGARLKIGQAQSLLAEYLRNPDLDFHQRVADMAQCVRVNAKTIGLGKIYGRGSRAIVAQLLADGAIREDAEDAYFAVNRELAWIKDLDQDSTAKLTQYGYVTTLLGRRRRIANPRFYYRGVNARIQGSASEQLKLAMVTIYEDTGEIPMLPVHDELNYNLPTDGNGGIDKEVHRRRVDIMENVMHEELDIAMPFPVDSKTGNTW